MNELDGLWFGIVVEETDPGMESFSLMLKREILGEDSGLRPRANPVMVVKRWQRMGYLN